MDDDHEKETGEPVDVHDFTHQTLSETVPRFCIDVVEHACGSSWKFNKGFTAYVNTPFLAPLSKLMVLWSSRCWKYLALLGAE